MDNDIPKYRKKKNSSTSKSCTKSKHRHQYKQCLLMKEHRPYRATYCTICGKIDDVRFGETERMENGMLRMLDDDEVIEKYRDLEQIEISDIWQKYIPIKE